MVDKFSTMKLSRSKLEEPDGAAFSLPANEKNSIKIQSIDGIESFLRQRYSKMC